MGAASMKKFMADAPAKVAPLRQADSIGKLAERANAIAAMLAARRFDAASPPPKPRAIFTLGDAVIATPGNLVAISAQAKAGKTSFLSGMIASPMSPTGDTLGVTSSNPSAAAVVHFDTEQSPCDHHSVIIQALRRAGCEAPKWLRSYCLTDISIEDRRAMLRYELESGAAEHGAIHSVFLDGVADFCHDPNDTKEAFDLVAELHKLAISFDTSILCIIHENPTQQVGGGNKTRGHLGSQLERKAETNLCLSKDGDGVTDIFSEKARHAYIAKGRGPRFSWNPSAMMHTTVATVAAVKSSAKLERLRGLATAIYADVPDLIGLSWEEIHAQIEKAEGITRSGARKKFDALCEAKLIRKNADRYRLA